MFADYDEALPAAKLLVSSRTATAAQAPKIRRSRCLASRSPPVTSALGILKTGISADSLAALALPSKLQGMAAPLTARELRLIQLIAMGRTNREIAEQLSLAEQTIKNAISQVLRKCNARNRVQLASIALANSEGNASVRFA